MKLESIMSGIKASTVISYLLLALSVALIVLAVLSCIMKKRELRVVAFSAFAVSLIGLFISFTVLQEYKQDKATYEAFFNGEGTPISDIADKFASDMDDAIKQTNEEFRNLQERLDEIENQYNVSPD